MMITITERSCSQQPAAARRYLQVEAARGGSQARGRQKGHVHDHGACHAIAS
jgi:hypothetical protein